MNKTRRIRRMRRVVIGAADCAREVAERGGVRISAIFVTLTYERDGQWSSRHVSDYLKRVREWSERRGVRLSYQWVIELTKRGRPHYHLLFWAPKGMRIPKPDESGQWPHGSSRIESAHKPVGYLVKYATKGGVENAELPRGARLFGVGAGGCADVALARHRFGLPIWLFNSTSVEARCRRVANIGWVQLSSGEVFETPYTVEFVKDDLNLVCVVVTEKQK